MVITEAARHHLYQRLEAVLGPEEASTLMEHLPPVGWADVATKRDLDQLEERIGHRFAQVDVRFDQIDARFAQVDARFDQVDARFDQIDARFVGSDRRVDTKLDAHDDRMVRAMAELENRILRELRSSREQSHLEQRRLLGTLAVAPLLTIVGLAVTASGLG